jgi:hypothetical protein
MNLPPGQPRQEYRVSPAPELDIVSCLEYPRLTVEVETKPDRLYKTGPCGPATIITCNWSRPRFPSQFLKLTRATFRLFIFYLFLRREMQDALADLFCGSEP